MKKIVLWIIAIICLLAGFTFWCLGYRELMFASMICAILCECTLLFMNLGGRTKK